MSDEDRRPRPDATEALSEAEIAEAATRVLPGDAEPFARPTRDTIADPPIERGSLAGEATDDDVLIATRVLEPEDKTGPPPAAERARPAPAASPAPRPAQSDRGLQPGTILFGEYEIVSVLGAGGMGEVYRARHRRLDEHRAIKVMHAELSKRRGASEFFYREAKALLAVRHPAVVHCHDLLSDDAGRVYLIMEMIEGIPLSKRLGQGPLAPDDVAILGARVAHGLAAAHRKGVIHRDLSPDNIVLPGGRVHEAKLIDFGIAKLLEQGEGTIVDGFKGKLTYASPEQLGFFGGRLDGRSDLYSLGLVLAAAALGRPMPMGTTVMEAVDARRNLTSLPDAIPVGLRSAILPLLALDPDDRPRYVDRLFVAPGAVDVGADPDPYGDASSGARWTAARDAAPASAWGQRTGLVAGAAFAAVAAGAGAFFLLRPGGAELEASVSPGTSRAEQTAPADERDADAALSATRSEAAPAARADAAAPGSGAANPAESTSALAAASAGSAAVDGSGIAAGEPSVERASPEQPAARAVAPAEPRAAARAAPRKSGPSAKDRVRIVGMLTSAKLALGENHLMSPPGDNAFEKYRAVLALDPANDTARSGLREIASRLVARAEGALDEGDTASAREALRQARQADASFSGIREAEQRLAGAGG